MQATTDPVGAADRHFLASSWQVLLVDDDSVTLRAVGQLLRKCGYNVQCASSGREALQLLEASKAGGAPIDLVLTDLRMPDGSGFDLLSDVVHGTMFSEVPVVVMSSTDSQDAVLQAFEAGAADYLIKPLRRNEVATLWQHVWRANRYKASIQHASGATDAQGSGCANNHYDPVAPGGAGGVAKPSIDNQRAAAHHPQNPVTVAAAAAREASGSLQPAAATGKNGSSGASTSQMEGSAMVTSAAGETFGRSAPTSASNGHAGAALAQRLAADPSAAAGAAGGRSARSSHFRGAASFPQQSVLTGLSRKTAGPNGLAHTAQGAETSAAPHRLSVEARVGAGPMQRSDDASDASDSEENGRATSPITQPDEDIVMKGAGEAVVILPGSSPVSGCPSPAPRAVSQPASASAQGSGLTRPMPSRNMGPAVVGLSNGSDAAATVAAQLPLALQELAALGLRKPESVHGVGIVGGGVMLDPSSLQHGVPMVGTGGTAIIGGSGHMVEQEDVEAADLLLGMAAGATVDRKPSPVADAPVPSNSHRSTGRTRTTDVAGAGGAAGSRGAAGTSHLSHSSRSAFSALTVILPRKHQHGTRSQAAVGSPGQVGSQDTSDRDTPPAGQPGVEPGDAAAGAAAAALAAGIAPDSTTEGVPVGPAGTNAEGEGEPATGVPAPGQPMFPLMQPGHPNMLLPQAIMPLLAYSFGAGLTPELAQLYMGGIAPGAAAVAGRATMDVSLPLPGATAAPEGGFTAEGIPAGAPGIPAGPLTPGMPPPYLNGGPHAPGVPGHLPALPSVVVVAGRGCMSEAAIAHRKVAVQKYLEKKKNRNFKKKVRYESRKRLAEARPRVRGQFVKQDVLQQLGLAGSSTPGGPSATDTPANGTVGAPVSSARPSLDHNDPIAAASDLLQQLAAVAAAAPPKRSARLQQAAAPPVVTAAPHSTKHDSKRQRVGGSPETGDGDSEADDTGDEMTVGVSSEEEGEE